MSNPECNPTRQDGIRFIEMEVYCCHCGKSMKVPLQENTFSYYTRYKEIADQRMMHQRYEIEHLQNIIDRLEKDKQ